MDRPNSQRRRLKLPSSLSLSLSFSLPHVEDTRIVYVLELGQVKSLVCVCLLDCLVGWLFGGGLLKRGELRKGEDVRELEERG